VTDLIAAEWIKFRTDRSTTGVLAVLLVVVLLALPLAGSRPMARALLPVVQTCLATLGVLASATEYATGMIALTGTAMPHRRRHLLAKAVVVAGTCALCALLALATVDLVRAGQPTAGLLGMVAAVAVAGVVGLALGVLTRSPGAAFSTLAVVLFAPSVVAPLVASPWGGRIGALSLPDLSHRPFWTAALGLTGYTLVSLSAAAVLVHRRDVR
jgi:hypothetical protein